MLNRNKIFAVILMILLLASCGADTTRSNEEWKWWSKSENQKVENREVKENMADREEREPRENMEGKGSRDDMEPRAELTEEEIVEMETIKAIMDKEKAWEELTDEEKILLEEMKDKMPEWGRPAR